ncbi:hypothetical protein ACIQVK_29500 [Streptomyces sp. NPDC090493]|uniref:hypothetical protein n=1 Tax=Streptomyces sp. NPDC090493 TaxID=3365964 RepID=UPI00380060EC
MPFRAGGPADGLHRHRRGRSGRRRRRSPHRWSGFIQEIIVANALLPQIAILAVRARSAAVATST